MGTIKLLLLDSLLQESAPNMFFSMMLLPALALAARPPSLQGLYGQSAEGLNHVEMVHKVLKGRNSEKEVRVAATKPPCPSGCCEAADWVCCGDNLSCAETAEQCPTVEQQLIPGGNLYPGGKASRANLEPCPSCCCPFAGWYCCGEGMGSGLCAMDPADCP